MTTQTEDLSIFKPWPKMARLARPAIITEKLDGTNAQVAVLEDGRVLAGSRTRWIAPQDDNYGFAGWVEENASELRTLGVGRHFGEWWGCGIQRGYGVNYRKFSLFNVTRWCRNGEVPKLLASGNPKAPAKYQQMLPACCDLVPVLGEFSTFNTADVELCLNVLALLGSSAVPGFAKPEGIVVYHTASGQCFKKTIEGDESPKSLLE